MDDVLRSLAARAECTGLVGETPECALVFYLASRFRLALCVRREYPTFWICPDLHPRLPAVSGSNALVVFRGLGRGRLGRFRIRSFDHSGSAGSFMALA